jgi:hypothetical protein
MNNTSGRTLRDIEDQLEDWDQSFETRRDYSGRGMYGSSCIGFVTSDPMGLAMALTVVLIELQSQDIADVPDWSDLTVRTDSMGLSTILYFPNWHFDGTEN